MYVRIKRKFKLKLTVEILGINEKEKKTAHFVCDYIKRSIEEQSETRRCDYVAYRGGMRGAIIAICINDPRTHGGASHDRGRLQSRPAQSVSEFEPGIHQNRTNPAGDNRVTFPILITDLN